jgi:hypothetical protein
MKKAAIAWSIWEGRTSKLIQDPWEDIKHKYGDEKFALPFARIENHYFTNKGFFPRDGFLLEKPQIGRVDFCLYLISIHLFTFFRLDSAYSHCDRPRKV